MHCEATVTVRSYLGIHARTAAECVQMARRYKCDIWYERIEVEMDVAGKKIHVREPGFRADGRSPIDMVALVAPLGTTLRVICDGEDAEEAIKAITGLFELDLDAGHEFLG